MFVQWANLNSLSTTATLFILIKRVIRGIRVVPARVYHWAALKFF